MRGKDKNWYIVKYIGDMAYYANCKCGWRYVCGSAFQNEGIRVIYSYCPSCGARKRSYNDIPDQLQSYSWS